MTNHPPYEHSPSETRTVRSSRNSTAAAGRCPLCGEPNGCAAAAGRDPGTCWCMKETFPAREALGSSAEDVPEDACICQNCLQRLKAD